MSEKPAKIGIKISNKEYRQREGVSSTDLKHIVKSPAHFRYWKEHPQEETPALLFGRASHKYALEKEDFFDEFAVAPNCDRRTKAGKEQYNLFELENKGKDIISADDFQKIQEMREALYATPFAEQLLSGKKELSFFMKDEETGLTIKCRPDCLTTIGDTHVLIDYKSCQDASSEAFMRSAISLNYDMQLAQYKEIMDKVVSKKCYTKKECTYENLVHGKYLLEVTNISCFKMNGIRVEITSEKTGIKKEETYSSIEEFNNNFFVRKNFFANINIDFSVCGKDETITVNLLHESGCQVKPSFGNNNVTSKGIEHSVIFIAQEKTPPYAVNILEANEYFLKSGHDMFRTYLNLYKECLDSGNWYGYTNGEINSLGLPNWLQKQYEV